MMTLTELRYAVALTREKHFGRAAAACFVSQPTLSVAIKKLESELGVTLFERSMHEVQPTAMGEKVIAQAQVVLAQVAQISEMVQDNTQPTSGTLQLGMIYSIAPYLLPKLVPHLLHTQPDLQLIVQEDFTHKLLERVKQGTLDAAVLALPINEVGLSMTALYDEDFYLAVAKNHRLATQKAVQGDEMSDDAMLVLGAGHCFRNQVLQANPLIQPLKIEQDGLHKTFEGTSLETLRHMAASGIGITVLPALAVPAGSHDDGLRYLPFSNPVPQRRIVLVWRKNFSRHAACELLAQLMRDCGVLESSGVSLVAP